jgi:hypothetical protein
MTSARRCSVTNDQRLRPKLLFATLFLILAAGLAGAAEERRDGMLSNAWRGLRPGSATAQDIAAVIGPPDREADGVRYGSVTGLHLMTYDDLTASFFLREGRLLVIALAPRAGGEFPTRIDAWQTELGEPARILQSAQGKNHRVHVYSEAGLTATADGPEVTLVEVFPPMAPDRYEQTLYRPAPVFRK